MANKEDLEKVDCITEQEREFAQNALNEFNQKNYGACLQNISKLDGRTNDFKVLHNKYVAEYYKSDLKKTDQFQKNLTSLLNQFHLHIDKLDDVDYCVAYFNQALLYYHQKKYSEALKIMDKVYKFIEPMDELLGRHVGLLLVELYISVRQIDKALNLITYLHNHALNQATPTLINTTKVPVKHKQVEKEKKPQPITKATEEFLKVLDRYRIRCNLLDHSLKLSKGDIKLLHQNDKQNVEVLFLLANEEYLEGNFKEAMMILTSIPCDCLKIMDSGESSTVLFYNNMGVIHHAMGKPNLACYYYQKALEEETKVYKQISGDMPLHILGSSKYHEIMYNLGISLLYAGKPAQAFECLIIAVRRYHRNSRLWLRLAECCINVHKESNFLDFDMQKKQKELVVQIISSRDTQKVILTTNLANDKKYSSESQSYAIPVTTLEFASLCLCNAKTLLPSDSANSRVPLLLIPGVTPQAPANNPGPAPSSAIDGMDLVKLKNAILVATAYVSLCLGDYIVALENSKELLAQPKKSGAHKLLANLYAAESLVLLDKLSDALDHLNPENISDINLDMQDEEKSEEVTLKTCPPTKWFPNNLASSIAVMQYNIAVVKTMRGQLDQAASLLKQIWQNRSAECRVPAHILMLVLYVELQLGHADVARTLIKQYSLQQRFNG